MSRPSLRNMFDDSQTPSDQVPVTAHGILGELRHDVLQRIVSDYAKLLQRKGIQRSPEHSVASDRLVTERTI